MSLFLLTTSFLRCIIQTRVTRMVRLTYTFHFDLGACRLTMFGICGYIYLFRTGLDSPFGVIVTTEVHY